MRTFLRRASSSGKLPFLQTAIVISRFLQRKKWRRIIVLVIRVVLPIVLNLRVQSDTRSCLGTMHVLLNQFHPSANGCFMHLNAAACNIIILLSSISLLSLRPSEITEKCMALCSPVGQYFVKLMGSR